jgi:hypothetical protein
VAFDDGVSLSGNGGHVKSDAKILLIFQLITAEGGKPPYTRAACAPGREVAPGDAGSPTPGIPPPVMLQNDRQQGCFAVGFGLL